MRPKKIIRNMRDPESRKFWETLEEVVKVGDRHVPAWVHESTILRTIYDVDSDYRTGERSEAQPAKSSGTSTTNPR